ncbi:transaldolase [candidate division KSB1 bacterium]|nr:transaldolase [candidate division KSB1 bacterium]
MAKLKELYKQGQSVWLDYIHRDMFQSGELKKLLKDGVRGITSNPAIFNKAIVGSETYDPAIKELVLKGKSTQEIYDNLVISDILEACDELAALYKSSGGEDGFVSLEVSPNLAHDTEGTIADARRYHAAVNRDNLMIKVPATEEGFAALSELIAAGININSTLIFSNEAYRSVALAYISGLEKRAAQGLENSTIASVASYFVSRVDNLVDLQLEEKNNESLLGKISIANCKVAYEIYQQVFSGERWEKLAQKGAKPQRLLWGSTGTKNPAYSDVMYVDELIGNGTVNTVPPATLKAFMDHGVVSETVTKDVDLAKKDLQELAELGINLEDITDHLLKDGIVLFQAAFDELMNSIDEKKNTFRKI